MAARRWPRVVLLAGVLSGLDTLVGLPRHDPAQLGIATDVYVHAGRAVLAGGDIYATVPGHPGFAFRYPPVLALAAIPYGVLGPAAALALQTALNLAALGAVAVLLVRLAGRAGATLDRADRALVGAYALVGGPVAANLVMGQVNPLLALAVAAGAWWLLDGEDAAAGAAFGAAALVKLFPALLGAWLLRQRAWRAIAAAVATGLLPLLVGVAVLGPAVHATYVGEVLAGEAAVAAFGAGPDPAAPYVTVRRQVALVAPALSGVAKSAVGAAALAPVVVAANWRATDTVTRLVGLQATVIAALLLLPLEPFYLVVGLCPLVPLLYVIDAGRPRRLFVAGALLLSVPVTYERVATATAILPLPAGVGEGVRGVAWATFGVALPPSVGAWLVLAACVLVQRRREPAPLSGHSPPSGPVRDRLRRLGAHLRRPAVGFYGLGLGLAALGLLHLLTDPAPRRPIYETGIVLVLAAGVLHAGHEVRVRSLRRESVVRALWLTLATAAGFVALAALVGLIWGLEGDQGHHTQFMLVFAAALGGAVGGRLSLYEAHLREELAENDALTKLLRVNERVLRHNLRNDLTVALGHLENLEARLGDDPDLRHVERRVRAVLDTSDRARRVVGIWESDVTDSFDLRALVVDAVADLHDAHPDAANPSVAVPHGLRVEAHAALPQALAEVLENAIVHNEAPVDVTVSASVPEQGDVALLVADDGAGIGRGELAALFGDAETPLVHGGGVGLPLVYWVVRQSDGELSVAERDGGGTAVTLRLSRAE